MSVCFCSRMFDMCTHVTQVKYNKYKVKAKKGSE
jgi:hypothetical protein